MMNNNFPISIIIFGASGDLTQRKLIPSLFNLCRKGRLSTNFNIVGFGGTAFTDEEFRAHLMDGAKQFSNFKFIEQEWAEFAPRLHYQQGKYAEGAGLDTLAER